MAGGVLVFGSNGQVGSHVRRLFADATFLERSDVDLNDSQALFESISNRKPQTIVNCAAYTAVDRAESDAAECWSVNARAPALMAQAANEVGARLVHISTDYVFDGEGVGAYSSGDPMNPATVYGKAKLGGELAISAIAEDYLIVRVSWVFSEYGSNFVKTMLRLGKERTQLQVVDDQIGCPTYAGDIAKAIHELLGSRGEGIASGCYHLSGGRSTTWYDFARIIYDAASESGLIEEAPEVKGVPSEAYPTAAKRPKNSVLQGCPAVIDQLSFEPDWETGLREMLNQVQI